MEFAEERREQGMPFTEAAIVGARQRFRPVMMTSFGFILGLVPLVIAVVAAAASRRAVGTSIFGGMIATLAIGIFLILMLCVVMERLHEWAHARMLGHPLYTDTDPGKVADELDNPDRLNQSLEGENEMPKSTLLVALLTAGIAASIAGNAHAAGFVCTYKEAPNAPKDLGTAKGLQKDMSQLIAHKHLADLVAGLRTANFPPAFIVDHLVWSYCPLVENDKSLTDAEKTELVRRFASQAASLAYGPVETDILINLPIVPALLIKIDEAAAARGISRDEWIKRAIDQSLAR